MHAGRARADVQPRADLPVREAVADQAQDRPLAAGERRATRPPGRRPGPGRGRPAGPASSTAASRVMRPPGHEGGAASRTVERRGDPAQALAQVGAFGGRHRGADLGPEPLRVRQELRRPAGLDAGDQAACDLLDHAGGAPAVADPVVQDDALAQRPRPPPDRRDGGRGCRARAATRRSPPRSRARATWRAPRRARARPRPIAGVQPGRPEVDQRRRRLRPRAERTEAAQRLLGEADRRTRVALEPGDEGQEVERPGHASASPDSFEIARHRSCSRRACS